MGLTMSDLTLPLAALHLPAQSLPADLKTYLKERS